MVEQTEYKRISFLPLKTNHLAHSRSERHVPPSLILEVCYVIIIKIPNVSSID